MRDEIYAAHWASNHLPRFHAGQVALDPWTGDAVTIDNGLLEFVRTLWLAGIRTVASCENVAEFAERSDLRAPAAQERAIAKRYAYVRFVDDMPAAQDFLRLAALPTIALRVMDNLVQIEFPPTAAPELLLLLQPKVSRPGSSPRTAVR